MASDSISILSSPIIGSRRIAFSRNDVAIGDIDCVMRIAGAAGDELVINSQLLILFRSICCGSVTGKEEWSSLE